MRNRVVLCIVAGATLAVFAGGVQASQTGTASAASPDTPADLNLPADFLQRVADRAVIDAYQVRHHQVEPGLRPAPRRLYAGSAGAARFINVVHPGTAPEVNDYRSGVAGGIIPPRGFRAPILDRAGEKPPVPAGAGRRTDRETAAAECVTRRLAHDGLLSTLVQVIALLGPERFTDAAPSGLGEIEAAGFPTDLLSCFADGNPALTTPAGLVSHVARRLARGATLESLAPELEKLPFRFTRTHPPFHVATESGEHELAVLRVQAGGGYDSGVVPGGSIDLISQLVGAFPSADFLIHIPEPQFKPFHQLVSETWRLRRTNQVTLIVEPLPVTAWAQDNGKAGYLAAEPAAGGPVATPRQRPATLAPRYASIGPGPSSFQQGESFLMDGLQAAGHAVAHSPLIFQGGNLLAARDPKSGERLLLIGEAELYRNTALGLTRAQALEAFRDEFGVDRCVVLPAVSYHLDFDVSLRAHGGKLMAFVNDTLPAARMVASLGLDALEHSGILDAKTALGIRGLLEQGGDVELARHLRAALPPPAGGGHQAAVTRCFAKAPTDSAGENFQIFLLALDLLESSSEIPNGGSSDAERDAYLKALRRTDAARQTQIEVLKRQGWKVVAIPSMSDLHRSINYLNGVHHRNGWIIPVFGGFYAPLDRAATAAFERTLGPACRITPIQSAECQRQHGAVHCAVAAYPPL